MSKISFGPSFEEKLEQLHIQFEASGETEEERRKREQIEKDAKLAAKLQGITDRRIPRQTKHTNIKPQKKRTLSTNKNIPNKKKKTNRLERFEEIVQQKKTDLTNEGYENVQVIFREGIDKVDKKKNKKKSSYVRLNNYEMINCKIVVAEFWVDVPPQIHKENKKDCVYLHFANLHAGKGHYGPWSFKGFWTSPVSIRVAPRGRHEITSKKQHSFFRLKLKKDSFLVDYDDFKNKNNWQNLEVYDEEREIEKVRSYFLEADRNRGVDKIYLEGHRNEENTATTMEDNIPTVDPEWEAERGESDEDFVPTDENTDSDF